MRFRQAAFLLLLAMPFAAEAQLGGEGLPDLSSISGAISGAVAPKKAGVFSSGMKVPTVKPGAAAKDLVRQLRVAVEKQTGAKNPGFQAIENDMPETIRKLEAALAGEGFAKRDLGVAAGYLFLVTYGTATGIEIKDEASSAALRTVAKAAGEGWGARYRKLEPAAQESMYETMLAAPTLLAALADQFEKSGKADDAKTMREGAGALFEKVFGTPPAEVTISDKGAISGFAKEPTPPAEPGATLVASSANGARVFVMYVVSLNGSSPTRELVLFPDGTAFTDVPSEPLPRFDVPTLKAKVKPFYVGRWTQKGDRLTVQAGTGKPEVYAKDASGGWADPDLKAGDFGIYFPVVPAVPSNVTGAWRGESLASAGIPGGAGPMTYGGSTGDLVFAEDGTFRKAGRGFAMSSSSSGDVTVLGKGQQAQGRWRLDGLMLTTVQKGQRGVQLLYAMPHWGKAAKPDLMIQGSRWSRPEK